MTGDGYEKVRPSSILITVAARSARALCVLSPGGGRGRYETPSTSSDPLAYARTRSHLGGLATIPKDPKIVRSGERDRGEM